MERGWECGDPLPPVQAGATSGAKRAQVYVQPRRQASTTRGLLSGPCWQA